MKYAHLSALIGKIKGGSYQVDEKISGTQLMAITLLRGSALLRGLFVRPFLGACGGYLFLGRGVTLRARKKLFIGRGARIGDNAYIDALCKNGARIGDDFMLGRNAAIECTGVIRELGEGIVIGDHVGISANAYLSARGTIFIGDNTIMGPGVSIFAENHVFADPNTPIRLQGATRRGVTVGRDCWIGANAVILDGVTVGDGAVVAAGCVVNRDVAPRSVVGGVPAREIGSR